MRVGHLTLLHGYNYGGMLQAWATQEILRSHGHEVITLDYHPARRMQLLRRVCLNLRPVFGSIASASDKLKFAGVDKFDAFRERHFRFSKPCADERALEAECKDLDAVVVGSDQVWSPDWPRAPYYLDFELPASCRRVSLAACCGRPSQDQAYRAMVGRTLGRFDHLSVRNEFTAALVRETTGISPTIICDPTIAVQVPRVEPPPGLPRDYVFAYVINRKHSVPLASQILKRMKEETGLPVVSVPPAEEKGRCQLGADIVLDAVSPMDWVGLVANAAWIITDSFHGTVFALKYHRNFNIISSGYKTVGRIQSILEATGLCNRILTGPDQALEAIPGEYWTSIDSWLSDQAARYHGYVDTAFPQTPGNFSKTTI